VVDLYLDHNVSIKLGTLLQQLGHDVVSTRDLGAGRLTDDVILLDAAKSHRMLVTHNRRDFVLLHDAWRGWPASFGVELPLHSGLLVMDAGSEQELARAISRLLEVTTPQGELLWWRRIRGWQRRLPGDAWEPL
jgi:hypothetical protein